MVHDYDNSHAGQCGYRNAEFRSNKEIRGESLNLILSGSMMNRYERQFRLCRAGQAANRRLEMTRVLNKTAQTNDCLFPFRLQLAGGYCRPLTCNTSSLGTTAAISRNTKVREASAWAVRTCCKFSRSAPAFPSDSCLDPSSSSRHA